MTVVAGGTVIVVVVGRLVVPCTVVDGIAVVGAATVVGVAVVVVVELVEGVVVVVMAVVVVGEVVVDSVVAMVAVTRVTGSRRQLDVTATVASMMQQIVNLALPPFTVVLAWVAT